MILAFDIGNTNIKVGLFSGDKLVDSTRLATASYKTGDEYWLLLKEIFNDKKVSIKDITGAIFSSVNPNLNYTIEHMIKHYIGVAPLIVGGGSVKIGMPIKYDNPKEVGADRIVGSVSAYHTYGAPCIIMDCGTATTFNVVNEKGEFIGGPISYGLKTASDALSTSASKLPNIELNFPKKIVNKNTISNMQAGILNGYVGSVEYIINKIKQETGISKVIGTGGISELVYQNSTAIDALDRTLTLRGLNIIYNLNQK